ncbi:MAG TPA: hypothetical protein VFR18_07805 [Terriglobia bacterium]|nr:hypothetical protein [Terriglobia bacterium]
MHDCQRFREEWIAGSVEATSCESCRHFCDEAEFVLTTLSASSSPVPHASDLYWTGMENRLRARILEANAVAERRSSRLRWMTAVAAAASLAIVLTWGSLRLPGPSSELPMTPMSIEFDSNHIADLDPGVVKFLGQSELFVRSFSKIDPTFEPDIEDARERASRTLAGIAVQKKAAADFDPVRITLDEYESILREIKNLDSPQDITDIQTRIRRNGLVANLKAYQPRVIHVSHR